MILRHLSRDVLASNQSTYVHRMPMIARIRMQEHGTDPKDFTGRGDAWRHVVFDSSLLFNTLRYLANLTSYDSRGRHSL